MCECANIFTGHDGAAAAMVVVDVVVVVGVGWVMSKCLCNHGLTACMCEYNQLCNQLKLKVLF